MHLILLTVTFKMHGKGSDSMLMLFKANQRFVIMAAMKISAVLFDSDGVLTLPEEMFSVLYTRSHGLDSRPFEEFFRTEWRDFVTGKRDLKEGIEKNPELWQWTGDADSLLDYWFKSEDVRNDELVTLIQEMSGKGLSCYLATEQEKYRAAYMRDVMFPGLFKGEFVTCDIGHTKSEPAFYQVILDQLQEEQPDMSPDEVVLFDDSQSKIDSALSVGINAQLYRSVDHVREVLSKWTH
jgi:HAD superfamily hydrolase (TIGR01509 family)